MAAVAPCQHGWGCRCRSWPSWYHRNGMNWLPRVQPIPMPLRVQHLLLSSKPLILKQYEARQFVMQLPAQEVAECVRAIVAQPIPIPWVHQLSIQMLGDLLWLHPAIVSCELTCTAVPFIFAEYGDVNGPATLFRNLLWTKANMRQSTRPLMAKFASVLLRRTQQQKLRTVPACLGRRWLVEIWSNVPSSRPHTDLTINCCVQWLADRNEDLAGKGAILNIIREQAGRNHSDAEAWILTMFIQQLYREPMQQSPDLQQLLWLLPGPPSPSRLRGWLANLARDPGCLLNIWNHLCRWLPQPPILPPVWRQTLPPLRGLMKSMSIAFAELPDPPLCSFAVRTTVCAPLPPDHSISLPFKPPSVGLRNTMNNCYMNTLLQGLFLTDAFLFQLFSFALQPETEDLEFGEKLIELLQKQFVKMAFTKRRRVDISEILEIFRPIYGSGQQQDVTETLRLVFNKLGGGEQTLLKEVFGGKMLEKIHCKECGHVKVREAKFTDLVVTVPPATEVAKTGSVPTAQQLLDTSLAPEDMDDAVECEICRKRTRAAKWTEILEPPTHLCLCLSRLTFDRKTITLKKETTPVKVDTGLSIGHCSYEPYHAIVHAGREAAEGHYYAISRRSEGDSSFRTLNDSNIEQAELSLLAGKPKEADHAIYVMFFRCQQATATPEVRVPSDLVHLVRKHD